MFVHSFVNNYTGLLGTMSIVGQQVYSFRFSFYITFEVYYSVSRTSRLQGDVIVCFETIYTETLNGRLDEFARTSAWRL